MFVTFVLSSVLRIFTLHARNGAVRTLLWRRTR
jgi:hypothetical protein